MFELKQYQKKALEVLGGYLSNARLYGPEAAYKLHGRELGVSDARYETFDLGAIPYVCLRLPTGGGKTVLASYAIREAARSYLEREFPLVLWLVPSNTIREQTLEALKQPRHPYRQAIDDDFGGRVSVFDIADVTTIKPQDLEQKVCIVVGTLASLRVQDTTGRKIYAHNENYEAHFARLNPFQHPDLERIEETRQVKYSFANLCHILKPLVIMDEAHNARTVLSFETLKRLAPACVIEFTATPNTERKNGSNVLYSVSATELKAEEMIKLPIALTAHQTWQQAVGSAVYERNRLSELAPREADYLRPIALYQAENKDKEVTVEVLKRYLVENENIDPTKIAVATGETRELDGVDLFDEKCPIEHIITVQALKEGWDCSFAYVFCSVANLRSGKDVEQLLGRVLRMPYAHRRNSPDLNKAYAHVSSDEFYRAATDLKDALIDKMGFEPLEAQSYVQEQFSANLEIPFEFRQGITTLEVERLDIANFPTDVQACVKEEGGKYQVTLSGIIDDKLGVQMLQAVPTEHRGTVYSLIRKHNLETQKQQSPALRGESFTVPRLVVRDHLGLVFPDTDYFLELGDWTLNRFEPSLPGFSIREKAQSFEIDLQGATVTISAQSALDELFPENVHSEWTETGFIRWLDKEVRQPDVAQEELIGFITKVVHDQLGKGLSLSTLVRVKQLLAKAIRDRIGECRKLAIKAGYQTAFFQMRGQVEVDFQDGFTFDQDAYPPTSRMYQGRYQFQKHFYPYIDDLKAEGEEFECARFIDTHPQVKYWVRNQVREEHAFSLPTSTDRFYPDFVALLTDGRILVVEYKGEHLATNEDTVEKQAIGELWAEKKGGVFVMATGKDVEEQIDRVIGG
jgi:type III restriction enzyme